MRSRRPKKRVPSGRPRPTPPSSTNHVWAYDFVFDHSASGQQLECLTVIDERTRECLAVEVAGGMWTRHVIDVLSRLISVHGALRYIRSDHGPESVSRAIIQWLRRANFDTAAIDPRRPWQNATNATFNDECLSLGWFESRAESRVLIEPWCRYYSEVRPHSSLGNVTPREFINRSTDQPEAAILQE